MLILMRRVGESIIINKDIKITVVAINGKQTKIGIDAPKHVSVDREEMRRKIEIADAQLNGNK